MHRKCIQFPLAASTAITAHGKAEGVPRKFSRIQYRIQCTWYAEAVPRHFSFSQYFCHSTR